MLDISQHNLPTSLTRYSTTWKWSNIAALEVTKKSNNLCIHFKAKLITCILKRGRKQIWQAISCIMHSLNPKRAGLFGPISQPGGGFRPPKISETDWRNIKYVVLVDSYDPPESIGTKKVQTYFVWRHSDIISDVMSKTRKSPKIEKIMVFRYFFKQKLHFLAMMCVKVCLHMFLLQINQMNKIKHSESVSWKQKTRFVCNFH